jgi:signal transduction histidine kinase
MLSFVEILYILFVASLAVLEILVIVKNSQQKNLLHFKLLIFSIIVWLAVNFLVDKSQDVATTLFVLRATYASGLLVFVELLLFALSYPVNIFFKKDASLFTVYLITALAAYFALKHYLVTGYYFRGPTIIPIYSSFFWFYVVFALSAVAGIVYGFITQYKNSDSLTRLKIKFLAIGLSVSVIFITVGDLVIPLLIGSSSTVGYSPLGTIFFIYSAFYAISKYQLFDTKIVITEIWVFILILTSLVQIIIKFSVINVVVFISVIAASWLLIKSVTSETEKNRALNSANRKLSQDKKVLKKLDDAKTEFVSMASHELLTPISAIEGYLSMILDEKIIKVGNRKIKEYLESIFASSKRVALLVTDLLNVSRIEEKRLKVTRAEFEIREIIEDIVGELKVKASRAKIRIEEDYDGIPDESTYADRDNIAEILINLLTNAVKYNRPGGEIDVSTRIWKTEHVENAFNGMQAKIRYSTRNILQRFVDGKSQKLLGHKQIVIEVKDDGIGLSDDDMSQLFKKFSRVGNWQRQNVQGTGLGLYISQALAGMNHGRIWAESEGHGLGSRFYLSLPISSQMPVIVKLDKKIKVAKNAKPITRSGNVIQT